MMDKKSSDVLLKCILILLSCHGHHSSLNSLKMSLKKDHLTIFNPASVRGIDHLRVLPPPLARIHVHLRVIHSITTILCQYLIVHVWIERGGVAQSFFVYENNAMNGQGSYGLKFYIALINITQKTQTVADGNFVDCKTVRIFLSPQGSRTSRM